MRTRARCFSSISFVATLSSGLLLALALASGPAAATTITRTYAFSASNFTPSLGSDPAPTDPVQGQVTVTFDDAVDVSGVTSGITLVGLNIPFASTIAYDYQTTNAALRIGGVANGGPSGLAAGASDFVVEFLSASAAAPTLNFMSYVSASSLTSVWSSQTGSVTVVPEPSTALLVSLGLVALARKRNGRA